MQSATYLIPSSFSNLTPTLPPIPLLKSMPKLKIIKRTFPINAAGPSDEVSAIDYSSTTSVFPAEACEVVGGDACDVEMYPDTKLDQQAAQSNSSTRAQETIDREYLEYNTNKTVFPGEACDDLGGEFCEPEYQKGVHKE